MCHIWWSGSYRHLLAVWWWVLRMKPYSSARAAGALNWWTPAIKVQLLKTGFCVPLKFTHWSPNFQCDGVLNRACGKKLERWSYEISVQSLKFNVLLKREAKSMSFVSAWWQDQGPSKLERLAINSVSNPLNHGILPDCIHVKNACQTVAC